MEEITKAQGICEFDSPAYKRSRNAYTFECAFEYFATLLAIRVLFANTIC